MSYNPAHIDTVPGGISHRIRVAPTTGFIPLPEHAPLRTVVYAPDDDELLLMLEQYTTDALFPMEE